MGNHQVKVSELITELLKQDQEAEVLVDGYEMGVSDVRKVVPDIAYKNDNRPYWHGRYELNSKGEYTPEDAKAINAVYLPRCDHEDAWEGDVWARFKRNMKDAEMNKENTSKLVNDFPKLFRPGEANPFTQRSFEVSNGWFDMIHKLCTDIEAECVRQGFDEKNWPRVSQCKSKFGTFRFYIDDITETTFSPGESPAPANQWDLRPVSNINAIAAMIHEAESRSASVCERCGIAGTLFRDGYWRTHCELCEARYQKELIND